MTKLIFLLDFNPTASLKMLQKDPLINKQELNTGSHPVEIFRGASKHTLVKIKKPVIRCVLESACPTVLFKPVYSTLRATLIVPSLKEDAQRGACRGGCRPLWLCIRLEEVLMFFLCVCFYTPPALCLCHLARVSWGCGASSLSSPQSAPPPLTGIVAAVNLPRLTLVIIPSLICLITLLAAVWNTLAYFCHHPCAAVNMDSRRLGAGGTKKKIVRSKK